MFMKKVLPSNNETISLSKNWSDIPEKSGMMASDRGSVVQPLFSDGVISRGITLAAAPILYRYRCSIETLRRLATGWRFLRQQERALKDDELDQGSDVVATFCPYWLASSPDACQISHHAWLTRRSVHALFKMRSATHAERGEKMKHSHEGNVTQRPLKWSRFSTLSVYTIMV